jgi:hypothetical protein
MGIQPMRITDEAYPADQDDPCHQEEEAGEEEAFESGGHELGEAYAGGGESVCNFIASRAALRTGRKTRGTLEKPAKRPDRLGNEPANAKFDT